MQRSDIVIGDRRIEMVTATAVVVGTGSAGYAAADRLRHFGVADVVMVTDRQNAGTSRNAGSDKQTYYKVTLAGDGPDSVREMAETLYAGGSMDGDLALVESALSARCFFRLVEAGVPFPQNRYGEFVGYKTDHDPRVRATSVGPFTSKAMTEALEASVVAAETPILAGLRVIDVLVRSTPGRDAAEAGPGPGPGPDADVVPEPRSDRFDEVIGLLCLRIDEHWDPAGTEEPFVVIRTPNVVFAAGGPAGMYADAVYPHGQWGAAGAALRAGARGKNLTEWQFGLASIAPRWNVSGTYMQVLPRFVSTDADGGDEREFLQEYLPEYGWHLSLIFLKGYQWPFDVRKAMSGSSIIDLLVFQETALRGRRVFLDFRTNPFGRPLDASALEPEAHRYLEQSGALFGTPLERLQHMNMPAYDFYRGKGVDLAERPLEIAVCAQHNNGGLATDLWWQSSIAGLFPVGEAAGTHGVYRPGGAALNAGQSGATRAAQYIAARRPQDPLAQDVFTAAIADRVQQAVRVLHGATMRAEAGRADNTATMLHEVTTAMSAAAAVVRSVDGIETALAHARRQLQEFDVVAAAGSRRSIARIFLLRDILTAQVVYLSAMADYVARGGKSRGSVLVTDPAGAKPLPQLPELFRFQLDDGELDDRIQEVRFDESAYTCTASWRVRRPIPPADDFFENTWREFRETGGVS